MREVALVSVELVFVREGGNMKRCAGAFALLAIMGMLLPSRSSADGINVASFQSGGQVTYQSEGPATYTFPDNISGSGGLNKTGDGTLVLSGENSYRGGTTVSAGTLEIASAGALPAGTSLTIGNGGETHPASVVAPEPSAFVCWIGLGVMGLLTWAWQCRKRPA
jgi:fibronectin-binding autotransporter adhesin